MTDQNKNRSSLLRAVGQIHPDSSGIAMEKQYLVHEVRNLTDNTYVLRFDRHGMEFSAGQHITLGLYGDNQVREYSIYSTETDPFLEVLIREVDDGVVSRRLRRVSRGDRLSVDGPFGFFMIDEEKRNSAKFLFIATGTGIAPFHSLTGSYPELDYTLVHGVRYTPESYERDSYPDDRYVLCTSRDTGGDLEGRVTDYLSQYKVDSDSYVYLCGNCDMIYEVYDLLTSGGIDSDRIKTEVYF